MKLLRNKEIARLIITLLCITIAACAIAYYVSITACIILLITCVAMSIAFIAYTKQRYSNISKLSSQLDELLHGGDGIAIEDCTEGELTILQSEIYKLTVMLREQADMLRQDKLYLADSLADIAHQLRTPLTSMGMIASFIKQGNMPDGQRVQYARELEVLLTRIDWLITALLKISKIESGTAEFKKVSVDVSQLIQKSLEPFDIVLELRDIAVEVTHNDAARYIGDVNWSAEAVGNVIKNCIEHTPIGGRIRISCSNNPLYAQIDISDNGAGFDPADIPHLFERFYRGKNADASGFGIGLALARMIVAEQGGVITACNSKNGGAHFTIKFYHSII